MGYWLLRSGALLGRGLGGFLTACSPRAYRAAFAILVAAVVVTAGLLLYMGASHQRVNAWDSAFLLDGGWRLLHGQRPHTDFYSPFGALPLLIVTLGMAVRGASAAALSLGYAIVFPFVTLWAWWIARRRLSAVTAFLFAAMAGFLLVATHRLGSPFTSVTYAMQYNRLGWALLAMTALQLFARHSSEAGAASATGAAKPRWRRLSPGALDGASLGALLGLLLFTKVTYFVTAAVLLLLTALLIRPFRSRAGWAATVASFAVVLLAAAGYLRFDLVSFLRDMRMLAGVQTLSSRLEALKNVLASNLAPLILLGGALILAFAALFVSRQKRGTPWWRPSASAWAFPLLGSITMVLAGLVTCSANAQRTVIPLFAVAALTLTEELNRIMAKGASATLGRPARLVPAAFLACALLSVYLLAGVLIPDAASVAYSSAWKALRAGQAPATARVDSFAMADLLLPPGRYESSSPQAVLQAVRNRPADQASLTSLQYAAWLNDGLALLRPHLNADSRVICLDWINPFSFALGLPSPRGDALCWDFGLLVSDTHHPAAENVLRDATLVMEPKRPIAPFTESFKKRLLGAQLAAHFRVADQSALWILYARQQRPADL